MDWTLLRDDAIIAEWSLLAEERGRAVELPVDVGEWSRSSELRAELWLPPGARGEIRCDAGLESRAEGFAENDGFWFNALVSPRAGNIWEGWREIRMPAECFYTRGIPSGWQRPARLRIEGPEGSRIRSVRLLCRRIARGPRLSDAALLDALDPEAPGLERVRRARERGETETALEELASALRGSGLDRRSREPAEGAVASEADAILEGRIMGQDWSAGIDWNANPLGYIEWSIRIHMLSFLSTLAAAWRASRDPRYVAGMERILADWMAANPVPVGVRAGGLAWGHSLVVSIRAFGPLLDCLQALLECPGSRTRTIVDLLKSLWEHAEYLLAFESFPPSNKTIAEGRCIASLGCALPELAASSRWRSRGFDRLLEDMEIQVFPDGSSYQLTPGYQLAIAAWFLDALEVARKFGHSLDGRLEAGVRRMVAWCTAIARPDGTRPSISDAGSADAAYGPELERAGRVLGDAEALWVGTRGREGSTPAVLSTALRDSGYFVMRSGWLPASTCLLFEAGPYGRFHQHEDMLGFDLYAHGVPFIVDPGISSYLPDPWTAYYRGTSAHNTVLVDGRPQARRSQTVEQWTRSARESTVWRSDARRDVAVGTYDAGYAELDAPVRHRRAILFAKPDYFLLLDELQGEGSRTYEALFHFTPCRVLVDPGRRSVCSARREAANVEIMSVAAMEVRVLCGETDPVQGWVALGGQDVPAPVAVFRKRAALPLRTGYLIVPFGADRVTSGASVLTARRGDRWSIRVELASGRRDTIEMDWASERGPELV